MGEKRRLILTQAHKQAHKNCPYTQVTIFDNSSIEAEIDHGSKLNLPHHLRPGTDPARIGNG
ncbi:hypothetical protein PRECH8_18770 [Insulibacter thermoxylanivorax]|uniref:Uncharacterized protein n=1 Tax=Insulibacter thermoxylanivorax TaxID=2749268 RepID=A0A916QHI5_9BACL|nr:hypothetical protein PRECH8_18770 [Insulibacter thermoxylanivorax]